MRAGVCVGRRGGVEEFFNRKISVTTNSVWCYHKYMSGVAIALNAIMFAVYLIFWGAVFVIFYHLTRFGVGTQPKRFAAVFFIGSVILFGASVILFANLDLASLISK